MVLGFVWRGRKRLREQSIARKRAGERERAERFEDFGVAIAFLIACLVTKKKVKTNDERNQNSRKGHTIENAFTSAHIC